MQPPILLLLLLALVSKALAQECSYKTIAGLPVTYHGDNGPVTRALFNLPSAVAVGVGGTIFVADTENHRVRRIDPDGLVRPVAGTGERTFRGDGGPALAAALRSPRGLAVAPDGTLYIADTGNHRVRKVSPEDIIETVAGQGQTLFSGDGGPAIAASLNTPTQLALDGTGSLYILDSGNRRIRRVNSDGTIRSVAGASPLLDYRQNLPLDIVEGSPAASAENLTPYRFGVTAQGTLYIHGGSAIWRVAPDGLLRLWLNFQSSSNEQKLDGPIPLDQLAINANNIIVASDGTVYISSPVQLIAVRNGVATRLSESLGYREFAIDPVSNDAIAVSPSDLIRQASSGARTTLWTSTPPPVSLPASAISSAITPRGIAVAPDGTLYIAENSRILKLDQDGQLRVFAGSLAGSTADGTPALNALLSGVRSLAVDGNGIVYFAEPGARRVRKIGTDGLVRTAFNTSEPPAWIRIDAQNRLYMFAPRGSLSQLARYDPDGNSTVLFGPTPPGGSFWSEVSGPDNDPGMAVAKDGTVYLGLATSLANLQSSLLKLVPGESPRLIPIEGRFDSVAMAIGDDGSVFLAGRDGLIKKVLPDGAMVTIRNRDRVGFWGEYGFDSLPVVPPRIYDLAMDGHGGLLAADSAIRRIELACNPDPGPALLGVSETATSNQRLMLSAGQLISLYGFRLGPASPLTAVPDVTGHYSTGLDGTQVLIDGVTAPLLYASANQVNAIVPFSIDGRKTVPIELVRNGRRSEVFSAPLGRTGPALLSYVSPGFPPNLYVRMVNQDGSINGPDKPARLGSVVTVYASGLGITAPAGEDGKVAGLNLKRPIHPVSIMVQNEVAEILYEGTAPGIVEGVTQINFRVPERLLGGFLGCCTSVGIGTVEGVPQPSQLWFYLAR